MTAGRRQSWPHFAHQRNWQPGLPVRGPTDHGRHQEAARCVQHRPSNRDATSRLRQDDSERPRRNKLLKWETCVEALHLPGRLPLADDGGPGICSEAPPTRQAACFEPSCFVTAGAPSWKNLPTPDSCSRREVTHCLYGPFAALYKSARVVCNGALFLVPHLVSLL